MVNCNAMTMTTMKPTTTATTDHNNQGMTRRPPKENQETPETSQRVDCGETTRMHSAKYSSTEQILLSLKYCLDSRGFRYTSPKYCCTSRCSKPKSGHVSSFAMNQARRGSRPHGSSANTSDNYPQHHSGSCPWHKSRDKRKETRGRNVPRIM